MSTAADANMTDTLDMRLPRVLVVDDDPVTRKAVRKTLANAGFAVLEAESGERALELFRSTAADIVLLDVVMEGMDGYATCRALRRSADAQSVPILMLTGLNDLEAVDRAFDAGATDFITKPINWALLAQRVRYALRARQTYLELQRQQGRLRQAQRIARLGYWELDPLSERLRLSEEASELLGLPPGDQAHTLEVLLALAHEQDRERLREAIDLAVTTARPFSLDHRLAGPDGAERFVHQHAQVLLDEQGRTASVAGILQDITERRRAEALIEYQTYHDTATGLPNRRLFAERLEEALDAASHAGRHVAVCFLGIDRFKVVAHTYGHRVGDRLLASVAERLGSLFGERLIARFADDTLGLLIAGIEELEAVDQVTRKLLSCAEAAHDIDEHEFVSSHSVGTALYPFDGQTTDTLLKAADSALSAAQVAGGGVVRYYSAELDQQAQSRLELEKALRRALDHQELTLVYQPQIDVRSGKVVGVEALLRWQHPERGQVPPLDFIPLAEDTGLIIPIGSWVLRTACEQARRWREAGLGRLRMGVNLSARQFQHAPLQDEIREALQAAGLGPGELDLEITESTALHDFQATVATLSALREQGARASIDDFGTGYCALSYVQRLPIDTLKIDRSFVRGIGERQEDRNLARAIVALGHSLGLHVIAEGVETEAQLAFLREVGCDEIQGYLISPPLSGEAFERFLRARLQLS